MKTNEQTNPKNAWLSSANLISAPHSVHAFMSDFKLGLSIICCPLFILSFGAGWKMESMWLTWS